MQKEDHPKGRKYEIQEQCRIRLTVRKKSGGNRSRRQSQNIEQSLEKQMVSMGLLDVKEVGSAAYLFVLNSNVQRSECAEGKGEGGKEREKRACVCACGQLGEAQKSSKLSYSRDAEKGDDALTQKTAGTGCQRTSAVDGGSKVVLGAWGDIQWQQQAADTGIKSMQKIES